MFPFDDVIMCGGDRMVVPFSASVVSIEDDEWNRPGAPSTNMDLL